MKALFELEIEDNDDYNHILFHIAPVFIQLNKVILTCCCGAKTEAGKHLTMSAIEQADNNCAFINKHLNCKGVQVCPIQTTNPNQIN